MATTKEAKAPRTTAPAPKALRGGQSCFNEDGSPCLAVWKALVKIKEDGDRVTSQLENRLKDRATYEAELRDMEDDDAEFEHTTANLYRCNSKIKDLRASRDQFLSRFGTVIELTIQNKFGPAATPKEIFELADHEEEDEEDDEATGQLKLADAARPGAADSFEAHAQRTPDAFQGREFGQVKPYLAQLNEVTCDFKNTAASITPLRLAGWIQKQFAKLKTTEARREIFPKWPAWFHQGLMGVLAKCASGEIHKDDSQSVLDAGSMLMALNDAANRDIDAWLDLVGGKDSPLNKTILASAKAG